MTYISHFITVHHVAIAYAFTALYALGLVGQQMDRAKRRK